MKSITPPCGIPLLLGLLVCGLAQAAPPMSDERVLDHGYRYGYSVDRAETSSLAVTDTTVLQAWGADGHIFASRRGPDGEEIDARPAHICEGSRLELSEADALGWKIVYTDASEHQVLTVANLDLHNLAMTQSAVIATTDTPISGPEIARADTAHVVAWVQGEVPSELRVLRIRPDLTPLDGAPVVVSSILASRWIDLSMGPFGGILVYVESPGQLVVQFLGADGRPVGSPHTVDQADPYSQVAACPVGDGWLVCWAGSHANALGVFVDATGSIEPPGVIDIGHPSWAGLGVASDSAGTCLVAWREGTGDGFDAHGPVMAARLAPGEGLLGDPIVLRTDAPYNFYDYSGSYTTTDLRNLSVAWTGSSFAVLWDSFEEPPVSRPREARNTGNEHPRVAEPTAALGTSYAYAFPVLSQWIAADGIPRYADPLFATQETGASEIGIGNGPAGAFQAIILGGGVDEYLHIAPLDFEGDLIGPWARHQVAWGGQCEIWECTYDGASGLVVRPWGSDNLVAHDYEYDYAGEIIGTYIHDSSFVLHRLAADGTITPIKSLTMDNTRQLQSYDMAASGDTILVFYTDTDLRTGVGAVGHVVALRGGGSILKVCDVIAAGRVLAPSVSALPGRPGEFLMTWIDDATPQRTVFDPRAPGTTVNGTPWATHFSRVGAPHLISSPDWTLCVLPADAGAASGYDMFAARFDESGNLLDSEPFPISTLPANQGNAGGVREGGHFLVTYATLGQYGNILYGNRISPAGLVIDADGFEIANGFRAASAASAGEGISLVGYGPNRVRSIDATATSVLMSGLHAEVLSGSVKLTWWAMDGAFEVFVVKRLEGADLIEVGRASPRSGDGTNEWIDSGVAPGEYEYRIESMRRDGIVETLGPIVVRVDGAMHALSLRSIIPARAGVVRLRIEGPFGKTAVVRVYDVHGRAVRELGPVDLVDKGADLTWDGRTSSGVFAPSGIYWFRGRVGAGPSAVCRAVLLR